MPAMSCYPLPFARQSWKLASKVKEIAFSSSPEVACCQRLLQCEGHTCNPPTSAMAVTSPCPICRRRWNVAIPVHICRIAPPTAREIALIVQSQVTRCHQLHPHEGQAHAPTGCAASYLSFDLGDNTRGERSGRDKSQHHIRLTVAVKTLKLLCFETVVNQTGSL